MDAITGIWWPAGSLASGHPCVPPHLLGCLQSAECKTTLELASLTCTQMVRLSLPCSGLQQCRDLKHLKELFSTDLLLSPEDMCRHKAGAVWGELEALRNRKVVMKRGHLQLLLNSSE